MSDALSPVTKCLCGKPLYSCPICNPLLRKSAS